LWILGTRSASESLQRAVHRAYEIRARACGVVFRQGRGLPSRWGSRLDVRGRNNGSDLQRAARPDSRGTVRRVPQSAHGIEVAPIANRIQYLAQGKTSEVARRNVQAS